MQIMTMILHYMVPILLSYNSTEMANGGNYRLTKYMLCFLAHTGMPDLDPLLFAHGETSLPHSH